MKTPTHLLQYTSVRTRMVDGQAMVALRHTARDEAGAQYKTDWIEMPVGDVEMLVKLLQGRVRDASGPIKS